MSGHAQDVLGLDDQSPPGPDRARGRQGGILRQGELLGRARKVGDASDDDGPLQPPGRGKEPRQLADDDCRSQAQGHSQEVMLAGDGKGGRVRVK